MKEPVWFEIVLKSGFWISLRAFDAVEALESAIRTHNLNPADISLVKIS